MSHTHSMDRAAGYGLFVDAQLMLANFAGQVNTMLHNGGVVHPGYVDAWQEVMEMILRRKLTEEEIAGHAQVNERQRGLF